MKNVNEDVGQCALVEGLPREGAKLVEQEEPLAFAAGVGEVLEALCEACSCFVLCFRLLFGASALVEMSALRNEEGSYS